MTITVDSIFRILNFCVTMGAIVYIVRRFGVLYTISAMREEKQRVLNLNQEYKQLQKEFVELDHLVKEQEKNYVAMEEKFHTWQQVIQKQEEDQQQLFATRAASIGKKQNQKLQSLQKRRLIKEQLPGIVQESVEELQKSFDNDVQKRKQYTKNLIAFLKK